MLNALLGTLLGNSTAAPGTPGTGNSGGVIVLSGGSTGLGGIVLDASAPRPTVKVLSKLSKIPLGYRKAGRPVVTVRLSRAAQRSLSRSRNARMSVGTLANQDSDNAKVNMER